MSGNHEGHVDADVPIPVEEWQALSEQAADVVLVLDDDGTCEWSSSEGVPPVGRPVRDVVLGDQTEALHELLSEGAGGPVWLRIPTSTHEVRWVYAVGRPRLDGKGWVVQLRMPRQVGVTSHDFGDPGLDAVTGVAGRERALDEVAFLLSATPRTGKEIAVACCGMDDFAALNERLGLEAGDEVLRIVAGRICDALRSGDLVARLNGDRFLVVLRGVHHLRGAIRVANKVRAVVEDPIVLASGEILQTASVGVTLISRGESVDSVLERAEGAMALAKEAGRNTVMSSPPI